MPNTNYGDDNDVNYTQSELSETTVKNLRIIAAKLNLKQYQALRKSDLIKAIITKQEQIKSDTEKLSQQENISSDLSDLTLEDSSFSNFISRYSYVPTTLSELSEIIKYLYPKLLYIASKHKNYKISVDIDALFTPSKLSLEEGEFRLYSRRYTKHETNKQQRITSDLIEAIESKDTEGSGWKITNINKVFLNVTKISQLKGSSFVELSKLIQNKKAVLDIQNKDNRCFLYSIVADLYPANTNRSSSYS